MALRMAAQSLYQSKSVLGQRFRRLRARMGGAEAIIAMAHTLARIVWRLIHEQVEYDESGYAFAELMHSHRQHKRLKSQARALGYKLVPIPPEGSTP